MTYTQFVFKLLKYGSYTQNNLLKWIIDQFYFIEQLYSAAKFIYLLKDFK